MARLTEQTVREYIRLRNNWGKHGSGSHWEYISFRNQFTDQEFDKLWDMAREIKEKDYKIKKEESLGNRIKKTRQLLDLILGISTDTSLPDEMIAELNWWDTTNFLSQ